MQTEDDVVVLILFLHQVVQQVMEVYTCEIKKEQGWQSIKRIHWTNCTVVMELNACNQYDSTRHQVKHYNK